MPLRDLMKFLDWPGPALATGAIWGMSQQAMNLCKYDFQVAESNLKSKKEEKKKKEKKKV